MKEFLKKVKNYFLLVPPTIPAEQSKQLAMLKLATEFEKAAKDYDISDPYLVGKNAGRAEICRVVADTILKEWNLLISRKQHNELVQKYSVRVPIVTKDNSKKK